MCLREEETERESSGSCERVGRVRRTRKEGGAEGAGVKRREGVVPGSTNQGQDAIDRHVARGWFNGFHEGGGCSFCFCSRVVVVEEGEENFQVGVGGTDAFCTLRYTYW